MVAENVAQAQISPKDFCVTTVRLHKFENCFFTLDRLSGRSASSFNVKEKSRLWKEKGRFVWKEIVFLDYASLKPVAVPGIVANAYLCINMEIPRCLNQFFIQPLFAKRIKDCLTMVKLPSLELQVTALTTWQWFHGQRLLPPDITMCLIFSSDRSFFWVPWHSAN